jgi:hypothetical protein
MRNTSIYSKIQTASIIKKPGILQLAKEILHKKDNMSALTVKWPTTRA